MGHELIYTSAERGLRPGTRGFCTVAQTRGMPPQSVQLLEALSAYKGIRSTIDCASDAAEPVAWSHLTSNLTGRNASVISRIGPAHPDHTGRSNKLAHHVILQGKERPAGGPAWLCMQPDFLLEQWNDAPHFIEEQKTIPDGDTECAIAGNWARLTGDAGNAALLPEMYLSNPGGIVLVVFSPGMDMLPLIAESLALLPPMTRWKVTFNTYFSTLPAGSLCSWRCCIEGSDSMREIKRNPNARILDLTGYDLVSPKSEMAEMARTGLQPQKQTIRVPKAGNTDREKFVLMDNRNINMLTLKPRKGI